MTFHICFLALESSFRYPEVLYTYMQIRHYFNNKRTQCFFSYQKTTSLQDDDFKRE